MDVWVNITITLAVAGCSVVAFITFWGKTFVENRVAESLKKKQHELDAQLEKLKSANARVNHIMTSLYDEEKEAIKEISVQLINAHSEVHSLVSGGWRDDKIIEKIENCYPLIDDLTDAIIRNRVFIDTDLYQRIEGLRKNIIEVLNGFNRYINNYIDIDQTFTPRESFESSRKAGNYIHDKFLEGTDKLPSELNEVIGLMREYIEGKKRENMEV